jgi:glycosyltransferase involved in cell wall biosynthesis
MRILLFAFFYPSDKMGGAEYQTLLLGQGLSDLGHDVIFLSTRAAEQDEYRTANMRVLEIPDWQVVGRERHRQLITEAIQRSAPDVCYVRAFEELETVVPVCRSTRCPVVSVSCQSLETTPLLVGNNPKQAFWYLRTSRTITHFRAFSSIRYCAAHVCNTKSLQKSIQRWFPRKSIRTIYNGQPVPPADSVHNESSGQVIWVNNIKSWKRPEAFVDLAASLPQYRFLMIGRMATGRYGKRVQEVLRRAPANLHYVGPKPIDEVNSLISRSDLLVYTSRPMEGFGNSFLQAWFRSVPTLSLSFDLDGILESEGIGRCSTTFGQLVRDVEELMEDEAARQEMGRRAREYAVRHHSATKMVADYEALFEQVQGGSHGERTHGRE